MALSFADPMAKTMVDPMGKTMFQPISSPSLYMPRATTFSDQSIAGMNDLAGRINNWGGNLNKKYDLGYRFRSAGQDIAAASRFGMRAAKLGVAAGGVGAIAGMATGDNYNSTAMFRNAVSGAGVAAGGLALGAAGLYAARHGGASWVGKHALSATGTLLKQVPSAIGAGAKGLRAGIMGFKGGSKYLLAGGVLAAAGIYAHENWDRNESPYQFDATNKDAIAAQQQGALRGFQNSATGLVFGLHNRRHR